MPKNFSEVMAEWFAKFDSMIPGQAIDIGVSGKRDPELFTDMCKEYINNGHEDFSFTNDYKYFKRNTKWHD